MVKKPKNFASFRTDILKQEEPVSSPRLPDNVTDIYNDVTPMDVPAVGELLKKEPVVKPEGAGDNSNLSVTADAQVPVEEVLASVRAEAKITEAENRVITMLVRREKARRKKENGNDSFNRQALVREALLNYARQLDPDFDKKVKKAEAFFADM